MASAMKFEVLTMRFRSAAATAIFVAPLFVQSLFVQSVFAAEATPPRLLTPDDVNALHDVGDPQLSPDGEWIAYTVRTTNLEKDKRSTHVWMTSWDGKRQLQLT